MASNFAVASDDIIKSTRNFAAWWTLAEDDLRGRYARTALGPFWVTLSHAIFVCGYAVWSSLILKQELQSQFLYVATSLTVWLWISSALSEGASIYARAHTLLLSYDLPVSLHVHRAALGQFFGFLHNMLVYIAVALIVKHQFSPVMLLALPGVVLIYITTIGWGLGLGVLGQRYRDLSPLIMSVMGALFILTPVFWRVEDIKGSEWLAHFNPFYHLLEVVRAPLLGHSPSTENWIVASVFAFATLLAGSAFFVSYRKQLSYWI